MSTFPQNLAVAAIAIEPQVLLMVTLGLIAAAVVRSHGEPYTRTLSPTDPLWPTLGRGAKDGDRDGDWDAHCDSALDQAHTPTPTTPTAPVVPIQRDRRTRHSGGRS